MSIMSDIGSDDFPLYMSSAIIEEKDNVKLVVIYEGEGAGIDNVLLIGKSNNLQHDISNRLFITRQNIDKTAHVFDAE